MCAAEVPGPPGRPQVSIVPDGLRIVWQPPNSDGGDAIQNYVLESRVSGVGGKWTPLNVGFKFLLPEFLYTRTAREYTFRVSSMNRAGTGRTSENSEPFLYGAPRYTCHTHILYLSISVLSQLEPNSAACIRPLEERLVYELPASVSFECEFTRADLNVHWTRDSRPLASDSKCSIGRFGQVHRVTLQLSEDDMLLGDEEHELACVASKQLRTSAKLRVAGMRHFNLQESFSNSFFSDISVYTRTSVHISSSRCSFSGCALQESALQEPRATRQRREPICGDSVRGRSASAT